MNLDNGQTQEKHLLQILSAVLKWMDPPAIVIAAIRSGRPERFLEFSSTLLHKKHILLPLKYQPTV